MPTPIIELNSFTYNIAGKPILSDINCTVEHGEYLSIIGQNGAGKTTLIKCIANILQGGHGVIKLNGSPANELSQKEIATLISYVPQAEGANFPFTVSEFVLLSRYPHLSPFTSPSEADYLAVKQALIDTETLEFEERPMNTLSGGQKQRVLIAGALAQQTDIILLDEPTTFLDPKHQDDMLHLLNKLHNEQGRTIIAVTHDINHAAALSDKIMALKEGRVVFVDEVSQCMNNTSLQSVFDKTFLFTNHPISHQPIVIPEALR